MGLGFEVHATHANGVIDRREILGRFCVDARITAGGIVFSARKLGHLARKLRLTLRELREHLGVGHAALLALSDESAKHVLGDGSGARGTLLHGDERRT